MASAQYLIEEYENLGLGIEGIEKHNQPLNTARLFRCVAKPASPKMRRR